MQAWTWVGLVLSFAAAGAARAQSIADAEPDLARLAARCAEDLPWCADWKEASERALRERKLVLVVYTNYAPLELPSTLRSGTLSDPDFSALVAERFVALELGRGDEAAFRDPDVFGFGAHSFGSGFLFVEHDGKVVAQTGVLDASYVDQLARALLAERERGDVTIEGTPLERAERLYRRGELDKAATALSGQSSAAAELLRASIARRQRDGEAAHEHLERADRAAGDELAPRIACERAVLAMRRGLHGEAIAGFDRVVRKWPDDATAAQALFWLGAFDVAADGDVADVPRWTELVERHPESRWAFKAAANLCSQGQFVMGVERVDWPDAGLVAEAIRPARQALTLREIERAERTAVDWLIEHQRDDGSWWAPIDGFTLGSRLYTRAVSALCASSLIAHRERAGAAKAIDRTLAWCHRLVRDGQLEPDASLAGQYSIWSRAYVAGLMAEALEAKIGAASELRRDLDALIASIAASQHTGGGWPYVFLPADPRGEHFDPSASFLTAAVVFVLLDAREVGAQVPERTLERALDFLEELREEDGTFRYMPALARRTVDPEACGRGPVCAHALLRGGRIEPDELDLPLELFSSHRASFRAEQHKEFCHTGPTGFGAHYLLFDQLHAARAASAATTPRSRSVRELAIEDVLAARFADGSYADLPLLGCAYGTAMALLTFATR